MDLCDNSVAGAIWRSALPAKLQEHLPAESKNMAKSIFGSIVVAQKYAPGSPVRDAIDQSYRESQRLLGIAGLCALAPMLIVMFFLKNVHLDERQAATVVSDDGDDAVREGKEAKEKGDVEVEVEVQRK